jgi:hypothetical protein
MPPSEATSPTPEDVHSANPLRAESQGSAPERVQAEEIFEAYSIGFFFGGKPEIFVSLDTLPVVPSLRRHAA